MYLLKLFLTIYFLSTLQLFANGNNYHSTKKFKKWEVSSFSSSGEIREVKDNQRKKKVIALNGDGTKSSYIYSFKTSLDENQVLEWEMFYEEDFVILVDINTSFGKRSLIYTPSSSDGYLHFGLGEGAISSQWKRYRRDLQQDLNMDEPRNSVTAVNYFVIRGSGSLDKLALVKEKKAEVTKVPLKQAKKMVNKVIKQGSKKQSELPRIKILGKNPVMLKRGQQYMEEGAIARDLDGSRLEISMSHNIDPYIDGEYSVIYMTTNSLGNTAVDRRVVRVGDFLTASYGKQSQVQEVEEEMDEEVEEEELSLIEQLLPQDKRVKEKNSLELPSRPGL